MTNRFAVSDTVEVVAHSAWQGEIGEVIAIEGPSIFVRLPDSPTAMPFVAQELRHSQYKLDL